MSKQVAGREEILMRMKRKKKRARYQVGEIDFLYSMFEQVKCTEYVGK
jgi:hypothetical protein